MKTVKAFGPGDLRVIEVPDPVPAEQEVLIAVHASGICGSDKWFWKVTEPVEYVAGHEVAGHVLAVGPGVQKLQPGDPVAVNNVKGCGNCPACLAGRFTFCPFQLEHIGHGFSELTVVPERNCLLLDKNTGYEAGSLLFDLWGTPFAALERAGVAPEQHAVIFGGGPVGLAAVVLARLQGANVITVEPVAYRREAALRLGAEAVLPPGEETVSAILEITSGKGADVVIECSGNGAAYLLAFPVLRKGGTLVSVGEGACFEFLPGKMLIEKSIHMFGSFYSTMEQGRHIQNLVLENEIDPLCLVTHHFTLQDLPGIFGKVIEFRDKILKALIIF